MSRQITLFPGVLFEADEGILLRFKLSRGPNDELIYRVEDTMIEPDHNDVLTQLSEAAAGRSETEGLTRSVSVALLEAAVAEITYLRSIAGKVTRGETYDEIVDRARTAPRQRSADAPNPQSMYDAAKTNSDGAIDPHADAVAQHAAMRDDGKLV